MLAVRRRTSRMLAIAVAVLVVLVALPALIPGLGDLNPFKESTKDRSQPVLLQSLERLSQFRATSANLQVVVDVERDTRFLPDFIKGEKTLLVAAGSVDASVDFRGLRGENVRVDEDRTAVTLTLPSPRLGDARLDLERTRVFDRDRGLLDRVGDALGSGNADDERRLLELAQRKLAEAAAANPEILRSAERNTRATLEGLMRGLGFERVTIRFTPEART